MSTHGPLRQQTFVLEIDRRPTIAFEARNFAEAQELCRDADLRTDFMALTSNGLPVCAPNSALVLRLAAKEEIVAFRHAIGQAPESDQLTMTFLIKIDGVIVVTVGPEHT